MLTSFFRSTVVLMLAAVSGATAGYAQGFPERPITMVVPYAAGGGTDAVGRAIGESMAAALGQQVIIENAGGGGGTIGASRVARAAPDGYTILLHQPGLAAAVSLYSNIGFSPEKDLAGIGLVNIGPLMIVGRSALPAADMKDLIAWAKQTNHRLRFGHPGAGSMGHFCGALMEQATGAPIDLVPYRGGGPAMADTIAGHIDLTCVGLNFGIEQMQAGTLKGFGITSREASPAAPKAEPLGAAYPALDLPYWHALFAPAGTPQPVIDKLNAALRKSFSDPRVLRVFELNGMTLYPEDQRRPDAATDLLRSEVKRLGDVVRSQNIRVSQ
jgi:tripartite-type tricarboxylate transporter receptor subunit TctC